MFTHKSSTISHLLISVCILVAIHYHLCGWWVFWCVIGSWLVMTTYGVLTIKANYFIKGYHAQPSKTTKQVAITFDDGPHENTTVILDLLQRYQAKASFFCIGKQIKEHPLVLQRTLAEGHVIGNHTYTHSTVISLYSASSFANEIKQTDQLIQQITGQSPLLFRPPYGVTNPTIARAIQHTGHSVIGWNRRSFDTVIPSATLITKKITKHLQSGDVILLHDTKPITATVLEQLLLFLQENHYETVTVDQLFSIPAYA